MAPVIHEPQLNNLCIVRVKLESAYGADADPTNGLTALMVDTGAEAELEADTIERSVVRPSWTPPGVAVGAKRMPFKFGMEAHGGGLGVGDAILPPDYDPILQACGMQRTDVVRLTLGTIVGVFVVGELITGGTSAATGTVLALDGDVVTLRAVAGTFESGEPITGGTSAATANVTADPAPGMEYRPVTSRIAAQKSALIYLYQDHILYLLRGWRGTFELSGEAGKACKYIFSGTALWTRPTDVPVLPVAVPADFIPPRLERAGARLGAYDPIFKSFRLAMGGTVAPREDANSAEGIKEYCLGGRKPTLGIDPEQDKLANFDPYALWEAGTTVNLSLGVGQDAGNRWRLQAPAYQISKPGKGERGTTRVYQFEGTCTGTTDDEVCLTYF